MLAVALAGIFAVFHGVAHGAEIPEAASGFAYAGGFLLATALLHACGIGLGLGASRLGETVRLLPRAAAGFHRGAWPRTACRRDLTPHTSQERPDRLAAVGPFRW